MSDELTTGSAPVEAPSEEVTAPEPEDSATGGEQPEAKGEQKGGPLPEDVHPAVKAERERAKRYRQMLERVFTLDEQGRPVGYNPEFLAHLESSLAQQPVAADPYSSYRQKLSEWATARGFLPEQVEAIVELAEAIADRRANEITAPILEASIEQLRVGLIQSGVVPKEAAPYVAKWIDTARRINPRALLTRQGRETVIRQALGDWYLRQARSGGAKAAPPPQLKPSPGPSRPTPSSEEAQIRAKLGLPVDRYGPTGE